MLNAFVQRTKIVDPAMNPVMGKLGRPGVPGDKRCHAQPPSPATRAAHAVSCCETAIVWLESSALTCMPPDRPVCELFMNTVCKTSRGTADNDTSTYIDSSATFFVGEPRSWRPRCNYSDAQACPCRGHLAPTMLRLDSTRLHNASV